LARTRLWTENPVWHVEIDAVSERLDDRDNTGLKCFPRRGLKIKEKRSNGTAAEIAQELALPPSSINRIG